MRKKERVELSAFGGVVHLVEMEVAGRHRGLTVAMLRVLLRVDALTGKGALVRGADVGRTKTNAPGWTRMALLRLRKGQWLQLVNGQTQTGHYELTGTGLAVCKEYTRAWKRAAASLQQFEPVSPFRRLEPLKK